MLVPVHLVVLLQKPGFNGGCKLHVQVKEVNSEGHTKERHTNDQNYLKYFPK